LCAIHAKRVTIKPEDMALARRIRGNFLKSNLFNNHEFQENAVNKPWLDNVSKTLNATK
jgi:hypothetical protein